MLGKILEFSEKFNMLPRGGTVLAAVSGGADSMCLLSVLMQLREKYGYTLCAMHFNHRLRGAESDRDEQFVKDYCAQAGIAFYASSGDVKKAAEESGETVEEAARRLRYDFFYETAEKTGAVRIATAHTADDNAETVLMRLARGTGLKGLCGIPPVRDIIIRPLLQTTREQVEKYLAEKQVPHVEDSTNALDDYTRNKIRHNVIPVMRTVNPEFSRAVSGLTRTAAEDEEYLDGLAASFVEENFKDGRISAEKTAALPAPVKRRVIRRLTGYPLSLQHTEMVAALCAGDSPSACVSVPGCRLRREYGDLVVDEEPEKETFEAVTLEPGDVKTLPELGLTVRCEETVPGETDREIHKSFNTYLFEKRKICGKLVVRPRKQGDELSFCGRGVTKSLKKLFIENKIPRHKRELIPVIADDAGVLAVRGIGTDKRAVPEKGSTVLKITFKESFQNGEIDR